MTGGNLPKVLILGANGQVARHATQRFLKTTEAYLTLYLRRANRLQNPDSERCRIVEGDVLDRGALESAMVGQDVVFASLVGDMPRQAESIVACMKEVGLKRLIFISSMGIYDEVPGEQYRSVLDPYRDSAAVVEASGLDYTVLRPGWFVRRPSDHYSITRKGEAFRGHDVTLDALSRLVVELSNDPELHVGESLGVSDV